MFTCGSRCCGIVVVVQSLTTSRSSSSSPLFRQGSWLSLRSSSCRRHLVFRRRRWRKVRALLLLWGSCSVGLALVRRGQEGQKPARDRNKGHAPVELSGSEPDLAAICTRPMHHRRGRSPVDRRCDCLPVVVVSLRHHCRSSPMAIDDEAVHPSPPSSSSPLFRRCGRRHGHRRGSRLVVVLSSSQSYFHIVEPGVVDLVVEVVRVRWAVVSPVSPWSRGQEEGGVEKKNAKINKREKSEKKKKAHVPVETVRQQCQSSNHPHRAVILHSTFRRERMCHRVTEAEGGWC